MKIATCGNMDEVDFKGQWPFFVIFFFLLMIFLAGCVSQGPAMDLNKIAEQIYGQQRTYQVLKIEGATSLTLAGSNVSVMVQAEMLPISVIPQNPQTAGALIGGVKDTLLMGLGIYTGGEVMKKLSDRPQVVRPEVVRPEIVPATSGAMSPTY